MKKFYAAAALLLATVGMDAAESLPYNHAFDNDNCLDGWTIPNESEFTRFQYTPTKPTWPVGTEIGVGSRGRSMGYADGWLISPAFALEAGREYKVKYKMSIDRGTHATISAYYGTAATVDGMTNEIYQGMFFGNGFNYEGNVVDFTYFESTFKPAAAGDYYIGLRNNSYDQMFMVVYDVEVTAMAHGAVPADPTNFTVTPSDKGLLSVALSATAPTTDVAGAALSGLTKLEFLRDGVVINTVSNPTKGQAYNYTDNEATNGNHVYGVRAVNADGEGNVVEKTVFVGVYAPLPVTDLKVAETGTIGTVKLSWEAPLTDVNLNGLSGKPVTYKVVVYRNGVATQTVDNINATEATVKACEPTAEQELTYYEVYAVTTGGESTPVSTVATPVGKPYAVPYTDNFRDGDPSHVYNLTSDKYNAQWKYVVTDADTGAGCVRMEANGVSAEATIYSGLIQLPNERTYLTFKYSGYNNNANHQLTVLVNAGDGNYVEVGQYSATTADWQLANIDLEQFKGKAIQFAIRGKLGLGGFYIMVTDININAGVENDLGIASVDFPDTIEKCIAAKADVVVKNYGKNAAAGYTVELYRNNTLVDTQSGGALAAGAEETISFDLTTDENTPAQVTYYVVVKMTSDQNDANNTSARIVVAVDTPELAPATNARVEMNEDDTVVTLKWDEPAGADPESTSPWRRLFGYTVLRDGAAVNVRLITETQYVDEGLEPGTYNYTVVAVYQHGSAEATAPVTAVVKSPESGIGSIDADAIDADAIYFDLQGRRVENPAAGMLLIKVTGNEATRVLVK